MNDKISNLINAFQGGLPHPWAISYANGGTYSTATGALVINVPANTASSSMQVWTYQSGATVYWDLTESSVTLQCNAGAQSAAVELWCPQLMDSAGAWFGWHVINGQIQVSYQGAVRASATYSSTTHAWLRIRETGGTTYYDYSADGMNWTNLYSIADSNDKFCLGAVYPNLYIGSNSSGTNAAGSATFDNFNFPAAPVQIPTYALADNLPAPVTSGTTIQSFVDVNGEVYVAKNGVDGGTWNRARDVLYATVYRNGAYTTVTGTGIFGWDTVTRDDFGLFSGSPNYGIVAPLAGWYRVSAHGGCAITAINQWYQFQVWAGPTANVQQSLDMGMTCGLTSGSMWVRTSALHYAGAGDIIQVKHGHNTAGLAGNVGLLNNQFAMEYVGQ